MITFLLLTTCGLAAVWDVRFRKIPNWLTIPALLAAIALHLASGTLSPSLYGLALALGLGLPLFALRGLGGGDVKLMAAAGAIVGWPGFVALFAIQAVLGGGAAVVLLLWKGGLRSAMRNVLHILGSLLRLRAPYKDRRDLDVGSPGAVTLPQAPVMAAAAVIYLVAK
ncbi:MAG: A24 family peptidase [Bryobacteraceae bacterium]